jgi:hypothetical protein
MLYIREELMTILIVVQGLTYIYIYIMVFASFVAILKNNNSFKQ